MPAGLAFAAALQTSTTRAVPALRQTARTAACPAARIRVRSRTWVRGMIMLLRYRKQRILNESRAGGDGEHRRALTGGVPRLSGFASGRGPKPLKRGTPAKSPPLFFRL